MANRPAPAASALHAPQPFHKLRLLVFREDPPRLDEADHRQTYADRNNRGANIYQYGFQPNARQIPNVLQVDHAQNKRHQHQRHGNQFEQAHKDGPKRSHPIMHKPLPMQGHSQEAETQTKAHTKQNLGIEWDTFSMALLLIQSS